MQCNANCAMYCQLCTAKPIVPSMYFKLNRAPKQLTRTIHQIYSLKVGIYTVLFRRHWLTGHLKNRSII